MNKQPERSVEEILTFIEVDGVGVVVKKSNSRLYLTVSGSEEYITDLTGLDPTLQTERQRCEEIGGHTDVCDQCVKKNDLNDTP